MKKRGVGQVVLITGASSGFGKGTALKLAAEGCIVYGAARRVDRMKELEQAGIRTLSMDVTDEKQVQDAVDRIIREQGQIDILLNNAGFGSYGAVEAVNDEAVRYQFEVNVFGAARLIRAVLPHMRKTGRGRIINTASIVAHVSTAGTGWYAATKHALKAMNEALRQEVASMGIKSILIEPGVVRTEFEEVSLQAIDRVEHPGAYKPLMERFKGYIRRSYSKAPSPESTIHAMTEAALTAHPRRVYRTTRDSRFLPHLRRLMTDKVYDKFIVNHLMKAS